MKEQNFNLDYDGNNIYITVKSNSSRFSRIFLLACNLMLVCFVVVSLLQNMPVFAFGAFTFLLFLVRYTAWDSYGTESLTINTRTITSRKTYLFIKSPVVTKRIGQRMSVISYDIHPARKAQQVKVIFETSYTINRMPENLYEFSFPLTTDQAEMINYVVSLLYLNKISFDFKHPKYSLN